MDIAIIEEQDVGRRKTAPDPEPETPGPGKLQIRGSGEWLAYVHAWCEDEYRSPGDLVEWAIAELAKQHGRPKPPRR